MNLDEENDHSAWLPNVACLTQLYSSVEQLGYVDK